MKKIGTEDVKVIDWCPRHPLDRNDARQPLSKCKECGFFGGIEEDKVICHRAGLPLLTNIHVTQFTHGDDLYTARHYDKDIDGEIEGSDPYDYCQKCDMLKVMPNGEHYCLLRQSATPIDSFICYEGEIWKKTKIKEEE